MEKYITNLLESGGPEPDQYEELSQWFKAARRHQIETRSKCRNREMWGLFREAFSTDTMQGFVVNKPHGYAGDFEVIDRIYTEWHSPMLHLKKWDKYFHWHAAPNAVRNRKEYFQRLLSNLEDSDIRYPKVLNVGCGPGRDIHEYIKDTPNSRIRIDCLDMDKNAIGYSHNLIGSNGNITYICKNALRYKPETKYSLVWSAGLFDYLDEKTFCFLFTALHGMVRPGGKLIVGNFSDQNPSREYMEFGEWFLNHRSEDSLMKLADCSGINRKSTWIESEELGVNLFLVTKAKDGSPRL